jgi:transposase
MFNGLGFPNLFMPMRTVCGLDVHKDSVFVCILNENGIVFSAKYGVLTPQLEQLLSVLRQYDVGEVCMESTSVYWMPIWRVLEPYVDLKLVNPYFIKQLPGKKSDVKDAEWIATCLLKDLVKGSYVPDDLIQQLRQYDRRISDLNREIVRKLGKLDAALQRCNIRISNYVSTTDGKSYREVVRLIAGGVKDPAELVKVIHGRTVNRVGKDVVLASLSGVVSDTDVDVISQLRDEIDLAQRHKDECQSRMDAICRQYFPDQLKNLQTIPGIKGRSATAIIAEVGTDMSSFEDAAHLVSWCGLKPRNEESAGKIKARSTTHGNRYLRKTLIECAWAASKTQGCFYNKFSYHQVVVRKKCKMKVQVAIARKILVSIWHVMHDNVAYRDYTPDIVPADA